MSVGRIISSAVAALAVAGCASVAIGMGRADKEPAAQRVVPRSVPTHTARPAYLPPPAATISATPTHRPRPSAPRHPSSRVPVTTHATTSAAPPPSSPPPSPSTTHVVPPPTTVPAAPRPTHHAAPAPKPRPATVSHGHRLPLAFSTGRATRVITVTARSHGSTTATLQAWTKVSGGWQRHGSAVTAHVGADGLSAHPSEARSATPIGSFTLTQAFGRMSDPGTALPYFKTRPSDYWISDAGRLYNTHQRCGSCGYNDGVNERLYYETPYYNYAVVIDYNTRNAPGGVHQGAGSAFFLHVYPAGTGPTAGCVAIPQARLVPLMRWLTPSAHPRILIGVV